MNIDLILLVGKDSSDNTKRVIVRIDTEQPEYPRNPEQSEGSRS